MSSVNRAIVAAGGIGSAVIALLQPIIYLGGPSVYRIFGAPPYIAEMRGTEPLRMARRRKSSEQRRSGRKGRAACHRISRSPTFRLT